MAENLPFIRCDFLLRRVLNYGKDRLLELAGIAETGGLDIISANVFVTATDNTFLPATSIVEIDGVKVGFFGLSPQTTPVQTSPTGLAGLEFRDYVTSAQAAVTALKTQGATVIVALAHISDDGLLAVANALGNDIDVIIEGHDHRLGSRTVNGVLIAGAGQYQENLGKVTLSLNPSNSVIAKTATVISKAQAEAMNLSDPETKALAETIKSQVLDQFSEVIGESEIFIDSDRALVRVAEAPLGNLVTDAMRILSNADIAFNNGGGLRADIKQGDITRGDINAVLPFGNVLVTIEVTPKVLKDMLEHGLSALPAQSGGFPQISGMTVIYDPEKAAGSRVVSIKVGSTTLDFTDTTTKFTLATNDFLAAGGDGYVMLAGLPVLAEIDSLDTIFERNSKLT